MAEQYYEVYSNFSPVFNTANALLSGRGCNEICEIISDSQLTVVNTEYDNWNGGTYGYTVYIGLSVKKYSTLSSEEITNIERLLGETINEVSGDENSYFHVKITPVLSKGDINWDTIGGETGKTELKKDIETIRNIMISVATGGNRIQEENDRYQKLHKEVLQKSKKLNLTYNNTHESLWDWYGKWRADFPTWKARRDYINELFSPTLSYFDIEQLPQKMETFVELSDWERIERTLTKIKRDSHSAQNEEEFQIIGLLCRDVIISLAQSVYNPIIHGETDDSGKHIGPSDAVRMLNNYITVTLAGKDNKELRDYIKTANALANQLTHKRSATRKDMLLTMTSTIALINLIGIIEDKY